MVKALKKSWSKHGRAGRRGFGLVGIKEIQVLYWRSGQGFPKTMVKQPDSLRPQCGNSLEESLKQKMNNTKDLHEKVVCANAGFDTVLRSHDTRKFFDGKRKKFYSELLQSILHNNYLECADAMTGGIRSRQKVFAPKSEGERIV